MGESSVVQAWAPAEFHAAWRERPDRDPGLTIYRDQGTEKLGRLPVQVVPEGHYVLTAEEAHAVQLVSAEFETDPMSVACFDRRTVERIKALAARLWKEGGQDG